MYVKKENLMQDELDGLNKMALCSSAAAEIAEVVVRGAILNCKAGSHYRYLNLPNGHGSMVGEDSVILGSDCKLGTNICDFGICAIKTMQEETKKYFKNASEIPGTIKEDAVLVGIPCSPVPLGSWQNVNENTAAWNSETLAMDNVVYSNSIGTCGVGDVMVFEDSGQKHWWEIWEKNDKLEDHDECKINVQEGDPLQVRVTGNDIKIDIYLEFLDASESQKKLIRAGIKQWEGTYKYVFGHKSKVTMEIHEDKSMWTSTQKSAIVQCMKEEDCLKEQSNVPEMEINPNKRSNTGHTNSSRVWDYSCILIMLYPISPRNIFDSKDNLVKDADGKYLFNVYRLGDKEFTNVVSHEFGHAMGLPGFPGLHINHTLHKGMTITDIMLTPHYSRDIVINPVDIEMVIAAGFNRKEQVYLDWCTLDVINSTKKKCNNEKKD